MSVVRFLATRQALALLTRRSALPTLQNCRTFTSLTNNNNNKTITSTTTITACGTQLQQTRDHKRFGHGQEKTPKLTKYFHFMVLSLFLISVLDWGKVKRLLIPKVDADAGQRPSDAAGVNGDKDSDDSDEDEDEDRLNLSDGKKIKEKVGFRERKVC